MPRINDGIRCPNSLVIVFNSLTEPNTYDTDVGRTRGETTPIDDRNALGRGYRWSPTQTCAASQKRIYYHLPGMGCIILWGRYECREARRTACHLLRPQKSVQYGRSDIAAAAVVWNLHEAKLLQWETNLSSLPRGVT